MDNHTAFWLGLILVGIFAVDGGAYDWHLTIEIGQLIIRASDWLAFWHKV